MIELPKWNKLQKERPIFIHYHIQKLGWGATNRHFQREPSGPASPAHAADSSFPSRHVLLPPATEFGSNICQPLRVYPEATNGKVGGGVPQIWGTRCSPATPTPGLSAEPPCVVRGLPLGVAGRRGGVRAGAGRELAPHSPGAQASSSFSRAQQALAPRLPFSGLFYPLLVAKLPGRAKTPPYLSRIPPKPSKQALDPTDPLTRL